MTTQFVKNIPSVIKSAYNMHCFSCNELISKGEEITQCIETSGMELRRKTGIGGRWVHQYCVPTDILTKFYMETLNDFKKDYPENDFDDICDIVENLDYWTFQERSPLPTPPCAPVLKVTWDSPIEHDTEDESTCESKSESEYFPSDIEDKSELEKSTLDFDREMEELTEHLEETIEWYKHHATLEQKRRVVMKFMEQREMDDFNKTVDEALEIIKRA